MPATAAKLGYGSIFQIQNLSLVYEDLGEVFNITPPSNTVDQVDVTHMTSPNRRREYIDGLIDPGECSFEMNYVPGSPSDIILLGILNTAPGTDRSRNCRIIYPNGIQDTFLANLSTYEPAVPTDDKMTAAVTFRVTGDVTRADAAAPANLVNPAISGLAKVGVVLSAYPGTWSGGPSFTYVWKKTGVAIPGATASTYTPVAGDIGAPLTVTVTASNSVGSASATSAATVNVIA